MSEQTVHRDLMTLSRLPALEGMDLDWLVSKSVLILEDSLGVASRVKETLSGKGIEVLICSLSSIKYSNACDLDLSSFEDFQKSLPTLTHPLGAVINLSPLSFGRSVFDTPNKDRDAFLEEISLAQFFLAKAFLSLRGEENQPGMVLATTCMGGDFGILKDAQYFAGQAGVSGILKCLKKEEANLAVKIVDLNPGTKASDIAQCILTELRLLDSVVEVGYLDGVRYTQIPVPAPVPQEISTARLDSSDVILVSGGARGITADMVREMATQGVGRFILAGRSKIEEDKLANLPSGLSDIKDIKAFLFSEAKAKGEKPSPKDIEREANKISASLEIVSQLNTLRSLGSLAEYVALDISDREAVARMLPQMEAKLGPVTGFIHGAGVLQDKLISQKTKEQFLNVFQTKINGLFAVLDALKGHNLKVVALFASVAGKFGNLGQCDYAAANEIFNHVALTHSSQWENCRFLSVNWGPFSGGMVTPELARMFTQKGVGLIPPLAGAKLFTREILHGNLDCSEIIVGAGPMELGASEGPMNNPPPLVTTKTVKLEDNVYLMDHKLKDQPVLPMAMALEWIAEAAQQFMPDLFVFEIRNLKVLQGVSFDKSSLEFSIRSSLIESGPQFGNLLSVEIRLAENTSLQPNYRAEVVLLPKAHLPKLPAMPKMQLDKELRNMEELYQNYLFHGPSLRCIESVEGISSAAMLASFKLPSPSTLSKSAPKKWVTEPTALDGMAQMGLIWLGTHKGCIGIPQGFKQYQQVAPFPTGKIQCLAVLDDLNEKTYKASVSCWFTNSSNEVLAYGTGWEAVFNESFNAYTSKAKGQNNAS